MPFFRTISTRLNHHPSGPTDMALRFRAVLADAKELPLLHHHATGKGTQDWKVKR
jgi:hypothetical protein